MKILLFVIISIALGASATPTKGPSDAGRIVGGNPTTIEEFPWIVSLQYRNRHRCGASIIAGNRILTAAHCTYGLEPQLLSIRAGSTYHGNGGDLIDVISVINHPNYNARTYENDVAVLWLNNWLNITHPGVGIVPMASENATLFEASGYAVVAGWGFMKEGGNENSPNLRSVVVPLVDQKQCQVWYGSAIQDGMLCAGFPTGEYDACQNDSGGPLTAYGVLIGVVSWGIGCARPNNPGVYARVTYYHDWIASNM